MKQPQAWTPGQRQAGVWTPKARTAGSWTPAPGKQAQSFTPVNKAGASWLNRPELAVDSYPYDSAAITYDNLFTYDYVSPLPDNQLNNTKPIVWSAA